MSRQSRASAIGAAMPARGDPHPSSPNNPFHHATRGTWRSHRRTREEESLISNTERTMLAANCGTLSFLCPLSSSWSRTLYHPLHCSHHWLVATGRNTGDKDSLGELLHAKTLSSLSGCPALRICLNSSSRSVVLYCLMISLTLRAELTLLNLSYGLGGDESNPSSKSHTPSLTSLGPDEQPPMQSSNVNHPSARFDELIFYKMRHCCYRWRSFRRWLSARDHTDPIQRY